MYVFQIGSVADVNYDQESLASKDAVGYALIKSDLVTMV